MAEQHGRYGYNSETETSDSSAAALVEAVRANLQSQINGLSGGGDPEVINNLQDAVDVLETAQADLAAAVSGKADQAAVNAALALRATVAALDAGLALKADADTLTALSGTVSALSSALAGKASTAYVDSAVATKASASSVSDLSTTVASKASQSAVDTLAGTVATKANTSYVDTLAETVTGKMDAVAAVIGVNSDELFYKVTRVGADTSTNPTSGWKNIIEVWWDPFGAGAPRLVAWFNEYGELRLIPGNFNTVPLRVYAKDLIADPDHVGMLIEIVDHREGTRTTLAGFDSIGKVYGTNIFLQAVGSSQPDADGLGWENNDLWYNTTGEA